MKTIRVLNSKLARAAKAASDLKWYESVGTEAEDQPEDQPTQESLLLEFRDAVADLPHELADHPEEFFRSLLFVAFAPHGTRVTVCYGRPTLWKQRASEDEKSWGFRQDMGMLRGEIDLPSFVTPVGHKVFTTENESLDLRLEVIDDDSEPSELITQRPMKPDTRIIPARHAHHRVHSLRPISRPGWPISEKAQRDAIEKIPFLPDVQGWLVCGPPGCGKTTYISAAIVDALTWREFLLAGGEPPEDKTLMPSRDAVEIYRLNVPEWLPEIQAWDLREFDDRRGAPSIKAPLLVGQIGKSARPILWLEELDDFNPTEKRIGYLHRLVDRVYTMKSTIVASTKLTPASLKEKLGPSLYRRLSGEFEPEEDKAKWLVWDFYQATKSAKPATKKPKAPSNPKASPRTSA